MDPMQEKMNSAKNNQYAPRTCSEPSICFESFSEVPPTPDEVKPTQESLAHFLTAVPEAKEISRSKKPMRSSGSGGNYPQVAENVDGETKGTKRKREYRVSEYTRQWGAKQGFAWGRLAHSVEACVTTHSLNENNLKKRRLELPHKNLTGDGDKTETHKRSEEGEGKEEEEEEEEEEEGVSDQDRKSRCTSGDSFLSGYESSSDYALSNIGSPERMNLRFKGKGVPKAYKKENFGTDARG
ncbi:hypothetical protein TWF718_005143 [Orbilia javanica]|uniref:Uncharacterized protein n=1 Tax=Orbilia javanica TaxID=47235 RepID=A0AAN8MWF3_9PEZI